MRFLPPFALSLCLSITIDGRRLWSVRCELSDDGNRHQHSRSLIRSSKSKEVRGSGRERVACPCRVVRDQDVVIKRKAIGSKCRSSYQVQQLFVNLSHYGGESPRSNNLQLPLS